LGGARRIAQGDEPCLFVARRGGGPAPGSANATGTALIASACGYFCRDKRPLFGSSGSAAGRPSLPLRGEGVPAWRVGEGGTKLSTAGRDLEAAMACRAAASCAS